MLLMVPKQNLLLNNHQRTGTSQSALHGVCRVLWPLRSPHSRLTVVPVEVLRCCSGCGPPRQRRTGPVAGPGQGEGRPRARRDVQRQAEPPRAASTAPSQPGGTWPRFRLRLSLMDRADGLTPMYVCCFTDQKLLWQIDSQ